MDNKLQDNCCRFDKDCISYIEQYKKCTLYDMYSTLRVAYIDNSSPWIYVTDTVINGALVDLLKYIISQIPKPHIRQIEYIKVESESEANKLLQYGAVDLFYTLDPVDIKLLNDQNLALLAIHCGVVIQNNDIFLPKGFLFQKYATKFGIWIQTLFDKSIQCGIYQEILKKHGIVNVNIPSEGYSINMGFIPHISLYQEFLPELKDSCCRTKVKEDNTSTTTNTTQYYSDKSDKLCFPQ